ncbi:MAG: PHP domain-containing protein [Abditibacteriota bacterium]|nr:PHP domain-containing protein [Abditibacteriota bacterium]
MLDYHIHTNFSDGRDHFNEMVQGAIDKGLSEFGISDHFTIVPRDPIKYNIDPFWTHKHSECNTLTMEFVPGGFCEGYSMNKSRLGDYFYTINLKKEEVKDKLNLKASLELEYFPENWDEMIKLVNEYPLDYIIGAVHKNPEGDWYKHICDPNCYKDFTEEEYIDFAKKNIEIIIDMVKTGKSHIVAHPECVCMYRKMKDWSAMYDHFSVLVKAVKDNNMCIEMNCWEHPENQDSNLFLYKECGRLDIPVIITSDAHWVKYINCGFELGMKWLKEAGVKHTATYHKCKKTIKEIKY